MKDEVRVPVEEMKGVLTRVLENHGFSYDRAALSARLFVEASRDGIYSHGLNRFPRYLATIENGSIVVANEPVKTGGHAGIEQWDGQLGPGNLNAYACMSRALELAAEFGVGAVALRNTNHWMRGGTYGWQAAEAGCVGICWTNTNPNLPPWGAVEAGVGNNPLVIGIPREKGHIVLDMAMSQFSYGALATHRKAGKELPVPGGFDTAGEITRDPGEIEKTWRPLPIGFWKGSALSIVLDAIAAALSAGNATHQIPKDPLYETGLSQFFLAVSPVTQPALRDAVLDGIVNHLHGVEAEENTRVYYPGQRTLLRREENLALGVPVDRDIWDSITAM